MISILQLGYLITAMTLMTGMILVFYKAQTSLSVDSSERLKLLKQGLAIFWLAPILAAGLIVSDASSAIGTLLPSGISAGAAIGRATAKTLDFEIHNPLWLKIASALYLLGLTFFVFRFVRSYLFIRKLLGTATERKIFGQSVWISDEITSACSFGILRPKVVLAVNEVESRSNEELQLILAHEMIHLKNHDPQWKLFSLITRSVFYFVPFVSRMHDKVELEMELICDRQTIQSENATAKQYGLLLINSVELSQKLKSNPLMSYMSETNLRQRIQSMKIQTSRRPILSILFAFALALMGTFGAAASSGATAWNRQYFVSAQVIIDGETVSSPQFIVRANSPATMEVSTDQPQNELKMRLVASESTADQVPGGIDLQMELDYKSPRKSVQAKPHIVVSSGEEATISLGAPSGEIIKLVINAERR